MATTSRIEGRAYREPATLDISGDTLTWRAQVSSLGGTAPENVVTTVHDVRFARVVQLRWSRAGLAVAALGALWMIRESIVVGAVLVVTALGLFAWSWRRPRIFLLLELRDRQMIMKIDRTALPTARALVARIDHALASGELPETPPALP